MDKNYNVDDILSEIKSRKSREKTGVDSGAPAARPPRPAPRPDTPARSAEPAPELRFEPPAEETSPGSPEPPFQGEFHFDQNPEPGKRAANPMDFTGHVRPITDKARMRPGKLNPPGYPGQHAAPIAQPQFEFQPPEEDSAPPTRPSYARPMDATTAVDFSAFRAQATGPVPPPSGRAAAGQQTQEHTRVLPQIGQTGPLPGDVEAKARRHPSEGYYDEDDLADSLPEHGAVDFSEYKSLEDRRDVATDIARVKLWLFIRTGVTALLTFVLFWLSLSGKHAWMPLPPAIFPEPDTMRAFLLTCTIGTALVAFVNSSSVGGGLISLFKMRANSDTLVTLALLAAIAQGVAGVVKPDTVDPTQLNLYFPIAALAMLFNALGKMTMINRIQTNFRIIATDKKKKALLAVQDDDFCREFVPDTSRRPTIAYGVRADFFTDFLGLSYSDKYDVGIHRAVAPVCLLGAVVVGVVAYLLTESSVTAISAMAAILCVCATFSATFVENIPLGKLTKKLAPEGGMVSGNKAVEEFCDTAAVILTENDLFPAGNIRLLGIKTFSQSRIDEAILDAASVICSLEGALSPVFLQMIGGNRKLLKKVDNVVYENGMGISAWVDSRRVLIGNRQLMQNHGIAMPAEAAQAVQSGAPEAGELLYLSNSGEAAAQFAVSYHIDEELAGQLDLLAAREKLLIIHTTDANITAHRVWELYGYPEDLIQILPAERHAQYREMTAPRENAVAEIVYTGRATTMAAAITACINARSSILSATILQLIQIVLGYGLIAFMAFMGAIGSLSILQICVYQLFWFLAIFIVQKAKQP